MSEANRRYEQRFTSIEREMRDGRAQDRREIDAALAASEKAIDKAERAAEKRFESVNEFRAALSDQTATLMPRAEAEARMAALTEKVDDLRTSRAEQTGHKSGITAAMAAGYSLALLFAAVISAAVSIWATKG